MRNQLLRLAHTKGGRGFRFIIKQFFGGQVLFTNKYGVRLRLNPYEIIDAEVIREGYFDEPVLKALLETVRDHDVVWDIGANIGLHALTLKKINATLDCYCFEPYHKNFTRLLDNQSLNPGLDLKSYNFALSDKLEIKELLLTNNNHGRTSLLPMDHSRRSFANVLTLEPDRLLDLGLRMPNAMKIDTEGNELRIISGCTRILSSTTLRVLVFESINETEAIVSFLNQYSFKVVPIDSNNNYIATR